MAARNTPTTLALPASTTHPDNETNDAIGFAPFRLMDLPFEIRAKILSQSTAHITVYKFTRWSALTWSFHLPEAACAGNEQLRVECLLAFLKSTTISVQSPNECKSLKAWLSSIGFTEIDTNLKDGFDAVRSLDFPFVHWFPYRHNHMVLAKMCKNLRELEWTIRSQDIPGRTSMPPMTGVFGVEKFVAHFGLDEVFELKELKTLRINVLGRMIRRWETNPEQLEMVADAANQLAEWFREGFEKRHMKVDVVGISK